jgi:hypothetical protein
MLSGIGKPNYFAIFTAIIKKLEINFKFIDNQVFRKAYLERKI